MKKLAVYIACTLLVLIGGCKQDTDPASVLIGDWVWVATSGGIGGGLTYKPATNEQIVLRFEANGQMTVLQNGNVLYGGSYTTGTERSIYTGSASQSIEAQTYGPYPVQSPNVTLGGVITKLTKDELEIADNNYDGFGSNYRRKK